MSRRKRFFQRLALLGASVCLLQIPVAYVFSDVWLVEATTHFLPLQILIFITVPQFTGTMIVNGQSIRVIGAHPPPPIPRYFETRNRCLKKLETEATKGPLPTILAGDLNCSPWSPKFPKKLHDPFAFLFRKSTWRSPLELISTPIDHVLYSGGLIPMSTEVGPNLGSDHLPIIVDFKLQVRP